MHQPPPADTIDVFECFPWAPIFLNFIFRPSLFSLSCVEYTRRHHLLIFFIFSFDFHLVSLVAKSETLGSAQFWPSMMTAMFIKKNIKIITDDNLIIIFFYFPPLGHHGQGTVNYLKLVNANNSGVILFFFFCWANATSSSGRHGSSSSSRAT